MHDSSVRLEDLVDRPLRQTLAIMQEAICHGTTWRGVRALKCPSDFWVYQQIIHSQRPDVILEIGVFEGGSTLALADLCTLEGRGRVIGVERDVPRVNGVVKSHRLVEIVGVDAVVDVDAVRSRIGPNENVLVIEDSDHGFDNTLQVLRSYSDLVKPGGYFIVEDTNCRHGVDVGPSPGPYEAVQEFLAANPTFESDRTMERFAVTWCPCGFLRRKA